MQLADINAIYQKVSKQVKQEYPLLASWGTRWNMRLSCVMGRAVRSPSKYIELSSRIVNLNLETPMFEAKITDTILHEWAHALDWEYNKGWGHGSTWKSWMVKLGLDPERCFDSRRWLVIPNKMNYAIRNYHNGRIYCYTDKEPDQSLKSNAVEWNSLILDRPKEELEIISLHTKRRRGI
jgi:predicted SprT family Zn-dependent metalloprotease